MTLNLSMHDRDDLKPRITVFGVGGAGGNAVNNMIEKNLEGVEFVVANTDAQALAQNNSSAKVQMGVKATEGLGAGARPTVGAAAAEETIEEIVDHLAGAHMCFITAGMGGGTGTGAAPIIAQAARELGVLTVGVVTKPFQFEGAKRMRQAEEGVERLQKVVDTLIIIPNQNLFRLANEKTTFTEAFSMADDVLYQGVKGVTDLMVRPGLINLDFADVRAVMDEMGKAMMGTGEADGDDRAIQAAEKAIANPLLDEISLRGAKGVLINITGGYDLTLFELDEAANRIREEVDSEANIIVGSTLDTEMEGKMRVSVVATGIDASHVVQTIPGRRPLAHPLQPTAKEPEAAPEAAPTTVIEPMPALESEPEVAQEEAGGEPGLFEEFQPQPDAVEPMVLEGAETTEQPAPAYQPEIASSGSDLISVEDEPEEEAYVVPKGPRGTPTPEAMARLAAAVSNAGSNARGKQQPTSEPKTAPSQPEKHGYGIGALIRKFADAGSEAQPERETPVRAQPSLRAPAPTAQYDEEDQVDADQEKIEIPAFLRRQAN